MNKNFRDEGHSFFWCATKNASDALNELTLYTRARNNC